MVKSTWCSCREPELNSPHSRGTHRSSASTAPGDLTVSSASTDTRMNKLKKKHKLDPITHLSPLPGYSFHVPHCHKFLPSCISAMMDPQRIKINPSSSKTFFFCFVCRILGLTRKPVDTKCFLFLNNNMFTFYYISFG